MGVFKGDTAGIITPLMRPWDCSWTKRTGGIGRTGCGARKRGGCRWGRPKAGGVVASREEKRCAEPRALAWHQAALLPITGGGSQGKVASGVRVRRQD